MASLTGKEIGKYRITKRIGRGGMAEVYLGVHTHLDRQVAIKVLHGHLLEGGDFIARFKREAKAVANLRHPNIVQVHDFDIEDEIIFMVMEYIEGTNLQKRLDALHRQGERLSIAKMGSIIKDVAAAVDYAHSRGMLHRDIKPSNILLDKDDKAYLADFGIARILSDQKFTATGTLMGTPAYMSPEQGTGDELSRESDTYSLGIVAFEMITGQVPYDAQTPIGIIHKQISDPIPDISKFVDDVPDSTQEVIDTALAKSPESRYPSADALVTALRGALVALESTDPTLREIVVSDPDVDEEVQYAPSDAMQDPSKSEEFNQANAVMEEGEVGETADELSPTIAYREVDEGAEEVESQRKIPIWGVIIGVVGVIGIVGVVLSQVISSRPSPAEIEPSPTEPSQTEPMPAETTPSTTSSVFEGNVVVFSSPHTSYGLEALSGGDADTEVISVGEEEAWRTGSARILPSPDENQDPDFYMIINVDDAFIYQGAPTTEVLIEVEYLDEGIDQFRIEYDAVSGGPYGDGKFKETEWFSKTNSGDFKIAVFHLDDANFANRINGGDFRLNDDSDGFETIRSVSVTLPSLLPNMSGEEFFHEGEMVLGQDSPDEAIEFFDRAIAAGFEIADLYHLRGFANTYLGHTEEAIEDWSRAIAINDGIWEYWMERGTRKGEKGDLDGATEDLYHAIDLNPENAWPVYALAKVYYFSGVDIYMEDALEAFNKAVELDPANSEFRSMRGELLWSVYGDAEAALADFDVAIENFDPDDQFPAAFTRRGLFYRQTGQFERCLEDFTIWVELEPGNPWARLERGDCYAELGDIDPASADYETFLRMTEGIPEFTDLRQKVQEWLDGI